VGVPGGKRGNVQTGGGDRASTISQPFCSTSVVLATGPTEEEEEELHVKIQDACPAKQEVQNPSSPALKLQAACTYPAC